MQSHGDRQPQVTTWLHRLTYANSFEHMRLLRQGRFGGLMKNQSANFFAWLLAHGKIGTQTHQETVQHIFHECPFTKGVRDSVLASCDLPVPSAVSTMDRDFDGWWLQFIATF
jgi:hypothetical protein